MNTRMILEALGEVRQEYLQETDAARSKATRVERRPVRLLLVAAIVVSLLVCSYVASQKWLGEGWHFTREPDPVETARSALENQVCSGAILVEIESITVNPEETARIIGVYAGSELAQSRGWSDEYLKEHFLVIEAVYYAEYDHTLTWWRDGRSRIWFWMVRDPATGLWSVADNTSPEDLP